MPFNVTGVGHPVIVSRIRRGGVQITPQPETNLEFGHQIRVVTHRDQLDRVTQLVGNPMKDYSEADFLSFSLGLILGVLLGTVPIPLPGGQTVNLGFAGGPLVVALILGRLGRTGPIVWTMPPNANLTMRQLGILFFLAGVGTRSGGSFVHTFAEQGVTLLLVGAAITFLSAAMIVLLARLSPAWGGEAARIGGLAAESAAGEPRARVAIRGTRVDSPFWTNRLVC